jgi:hypothetical protein
MATIEGIAGFSVSIDLGGKPAKEYDEPHVDDVEKKGSAGSVSRYIETQSDTDFYIHNSLTTEFPYSTHDIEFVIVIDGKPATSLLLRWSRIARGRYRSFEATSAKYQSSGRWFKKSFRFAKLNVGACV